MDDDPDEIVFLEKEKPLISEESRFEEVKLAKPIIQLMKQSRMATTGFVIGGKQKAKGGM